MSLGEALNNVSKYYKCDICNTEHGTHREAAECADQCLTQKHRDSDKVRKVD